MQRGLHLYLQKVTEISLNLLLLFLDPRITMHFRDLGGGMEAASKTEGCALPKDGPVGPDGKKLKPCCACPETKQPRDACIIEKVLV